MRSQIFRLPQLSCVLNVPYTRFAFLLTENYFAIKSSTLPVKNLILKDVPKMYAESLGQYLWQTDQPQIGNQFTFLEE